MMVREIGGPVILAMRTRFSGLRVGNVRMPRAASFASLDLRLGCF